VSDPVKIRCANIRDGRRCNRFLGEIAGDKVRFFCPQCREFHEVDAGIVLEELEAYVADLRERVNRRRVKVGTV